MRAVTEDCTIELDSGNSYKFRKGDKLGIFPATIHFDPDIYPNPEEFNYKRFINVPSSYTKNNKKIPSSLCFLPFGGGQTYCPGIIILFTIVYLYNTISHYILLMYVSFCIFYYAVLLCYFRKEICKS